MNNHIIITLATALAAVSWGCAPESKGTDLAGSQDKTKEFLNGIPLSEPLHRSAEGVSCDEVAAGELYQQEIELSVKNAASIWENCQKIFFCSDSAVEFLEKGFDSNGSFRLGFEDLRKIKNTDTPERLGGVYLTGTDQVYLDTSLRTLKEACPILLHEVVHRFDPLAKNGEESLKTEFRAYWYQVAFLQDLYLRNGSLGLALRDDKMRSQFFTRKNLLETIARIYKFKTDYSISEAYKALPTEGKVIKPWPGRPTLLDLEF